MRGMGGFPGFGGASAGGGFPGAEAGETPKPDSKPKPQEFDDGLD